MSGPGLSRGGPGDTTVTRGPEFDLCVRYSHPPHSLHPGVSSEKKGPDLYGGRESTVVRNGSTGDSRLSSPTIDVRGRGGVRVSIESPLLGRGDGPVKGGHPLVSDDSRFCVGLLHLSSFSSTPEWVGVNEFWKVFTPKKSNCPPGTSSLGFLHPTVIDTNPEGRIRRFTPRKEDYSGLRTYCRVFF